MRLSGARAALAVTVCEPADKAMVVTSQLPTPLAAVVAISVTPSVSYNVTVAFASAVPFKVGVVSLVRSSVDELPVSEHIDQRPGWHGGKLIFDHGIGLMVSPKD